MGVDVPLPQWETDPHIAKEVSDRRDGPRHTDTRVRVEGEGWDEALH